MKRIWKGMMTPIHYIKRSFYRKMLLAFFTVIVMTVSSLGLNFYYETSDNIKQSEIANMERTTEQAVQLSYFTEHNRLLYDLVNNGF